MKKAFRNFLLILAIVGVAGLFAKSIYALADGSDPVSSETSSSETSSSQTSTIPVYDIAEHPDHVFNAINSKITLLATVTPSDATDKTIVWTSSSSSAVNIYSTTVDSATIKCLSAFSGTVIITARATNGTVTESDDYIATCSCTFFFPVSSISFNLLGGVTAANLLNMPVGFSFQTSVTISPANATDKTYFFTYDTNYLSYASETGTFTAIATTPGTGTLVLRVTSNQNSFYKISLNYSIAVYVTSVDISLSSGVEADLIGMAIGHTFPVVITVLPVNAYDKTYTLSYDQTYLSYASGVFTALAETPVGETKYITVTTTDRGYTDTLAYSIGTDLTGYRATVDIYDYINTELEPSLMSGATETNTSSAHVIKGYLIKVFPSSFPVGAKSADWTYSFDNAFFQEIAQYTSTGVCFSIKAIAGTPVGVPTTVTVTSVNYGVSLTMNFNVFVPISGINLDQTNVSF